MSETKKELLERLLKESLDANSGTATVVSDVIAKELGLRRVPGGCCYEAMEEEKR